MTKSCKPHNTHIRGWADQALVNNKSGWDALGVVSSSLLLGTHYGHMGTEYLILQTVAGVEIDIDCVELQAWYQTFTKFHSPEILEAQHKISEILNKYI